ncbi:MAG: MFS transporter [Saprospiraceae bacterium]|nr:MFS transporter [Saprospiraceae bacterium]MBP6568696.1 MFS transporter [Saprospiraceae bacterium]
MSTNQNKSSKVPMTQKVAFGLGMLANQLFPAMLGIFMVILIDKLGFPGWMVSVIYFVPKLFDAITDPIMGFITDNTKSKWGRRRQYVIVGGILTGISFAFMWQLYASNSINFNFYYFLLVSLGFYLGITIFSVPFVAMGYEMSDDFHERTSIMATSQLIGQLAWVFAPWLWVIMYDVSFFPSAEEATRTLAVYGAIICTILAVIPGIFIKSKSTLNENYEPLTVANAGRSFDLIIQGFREALVIVPFRKLCIATFFIFNAFNTTAGFSFFIIKYYVFPGDGQGIWPTLYGCVGAIFTTVLIIPIVAYMSKVMGKQKAFIWSQSLSILGYASLLFLFVPGKPYLFLIALPFISFGIGSLFTLMMSMTSDVIDIDELNTGKRREGIFGAIYWWMVKFGLAIAGGLTGLILWYIDFNSGAATQTYETMFELRMFFSAIPVIGTLFALWAMWDYDINEEKSHEIRAQLEKKKAGIPSGYSSSSVIGSTNLKGLTMDELKIKFPNYYTSNIEYNKASLDTKIRSFKSQFEKGLHGICFSAYNEFQNPGDTITKEQIVKRLEVLKGHTQWIRTFSCTNGHELIPQLAKEMGFKTLVGAWISSDIENNEKELASLKTLLSQGVVDMASVGNEVLFRNDISADVLYDYIGQIKKVAGNIPTGYVDVYYEVIKHPKLSEISDILMINCYPYWEGADIQFASLYIQEMYHKVAQISGGKKIVITETGWPSKGQTVKDAVPSNENVMRYFAEISEWGSSKNVEIFYFSSFDESWKIHFEGWAGTAWGLWDKNENFKY